jgi:hypothetical protein
LANPREVLYLVNRPGNVARHSESVPWMDWAMALGSAVAGRGTVRGDTDFTPTARWDRGNEPGRRFILGFEANPKLVALAQALPPSVWQRLERRPKDKILSAPRTKGVRYKEQIVVEKGFEKQRLAGEDVAEIEYQPGPCAYPYRGVILRKNISVHRGEKGLFDDVRYFFYIPNRSDPAAKIVGLANGRCDQENVLEQLKNGVSAGQGRAVAAYSEKAVPKPLGEDNRWVGDQ